MLHLTKRNDFKLFPWIMWGLSALFYFYEYFVQVSPSVMVPDLMRDFSVTGLALGTMASAYIYAYASLQIPVGLLIDKYGPRRLLTLAATLLATGCIVFGTTHNFHVAIICWLFMGLGSAFAIIGSLQIAGTWLPTRFFPLTAGLVLTMGMLGAASGEAPMAILVEKLQWRHAMLLIGSIGAVMTVLLWLIVRDKTKITKTAHKVGLIDELLQVLRCKQTWLNAIYGGLMFMPTNVFGAMWGVPFLMQKYSISRPETGSIAAVLFFGWAIGAPLWGWVSNAIGRRKIVMYIGSLGSLIAILLTIYGPQQSTLLAAILLFSFGLFSAGFFVCFSVVRELNPPNITGSVMGFMNTLNMVGGAAVQPVVGWLLDVNWNGTMANGARAYSLGNYQFALAALPIGIAISIAFLPFIKETFCKSKYD